MGRVKHIDDTAMTISRKRWGRGYQYFNEDGNKITDKKVLSRLKGLVIPPMWSEVYVCGFDDGHIQAIGRDLKGRKQYIYHSEWEKQRQEEKFKKMEAFGEELPRMRAQYVNDIARKGWPYEKVVALMVAILDECGIRIGNRQYAQKNNSYGLSTMRRRHLDLDGDSLTFEFKGKSNQMQEVEIDDEGLSALIRSAAAQPGYEIFRYKDDSGDFQSVDSEDVNDYIHDQMGEEFTSKDFRTWVAGRLAVEFYPAALDQHSKKPRRKFSNILIRMVADELGNTPTVCKDYYVHPAILQRIGMKKLPVVNNNDHDDNSLSPAEELVMEILADGQVSEK